MTYPDNPQQPHSNPYDKAYPVSPFESEPQQQAQQQQPPQQVQQPQPQQQPQQWQQNQQQAPWQGPPMPPQQVPYTANPYAPAPMAIDPQKKNHLGMVAMIMGVLCVASLIFLGWWPPTIAVMTLGVSIVAFVRRKNYVEQNRMTGLAITGLVLSSVCITIFVVILAILVVKTVDDTTYDDYNNYRSYLPDNSLEDA